MELGLVERSLVLVLATCIAGFAVLLGYVTASMISVILAPPEKMLEPILLLITLAVITASLTIATAIGAVALGHAAVTGKL